MTTWELGINGFSWHLGADVIKREAEMALEIGYRWAYADMGTWGPGTLEMAHAAMASVGLPIWSAHGATGIKGWEFDVEGAAERMGDQIRRASELGIGHVCYHTMVNDTTRESPAIVVERRARFAARFHDLFGRLVQIAEPAGVSINVENIEGEFDSAYRTAEEIFTMIDPVHSDAMGVCLDSGHAHMSHVSVPDMVRELGPRLREVHFHDNLGKADRHRVVGVGSIDWVGVIRALDEIGYASPIIFEWCGTYWSEMPFVDIARGHYFNWRQFEEMAEAIRTGQ
jgi:sugar phosphate isomerase/epimerase